MECKNMKPKPQMDSKKKEGNPEPVNINRKRGSTNYDLWKGRHCQSQQEWVRGQRTRTESSYAGYRVYI